MKNLKVKKLTRIQHLDMISFGQKTFLNCSKVCDASYSWLAAMTAMQTARTQILTTGKILK
jgi:hypothetical protein